LTPDELACRFALDRSQQAQLEALLERLHTDPRAPTAVREHQRALEAHLADSLVALDLDDVRRARTLADLGSGAGAPGAVLAIALPACTVSLVESQGRKCAFLGELLHDVEIPNARVICARAEEWEEGLETQEVATARALAPQPVVLEYAAPLLRVGGVLVDWRGRREHDEEAAATRAAGQLGLEPGEVRRVEPYPGARDLHLHIFRKRSPTPDGFPRRAGAARKRPLGR
jgi:16S rRNA (guanine527-N7)-methyltransferase